MTNYKVAFLKISPKPPKCYVFLYRPKQTSRPRFYTHLKGVCGHAICTRLFFSCDFLLLRSHTISHHFLMFFLKNILKIHKIICGRFKGLFWTAMDYICSEPLSLGTHHQNQSRVAISYPTIWLNRDKTMVLCLVDWAWKSQKLNRFGQLVPRLFRAGLKICFSLGCLVISCHSGHIIWATIFDVWILKIRFWT